MAKAKMGNAESKKDTKKAPLGGQSKAEAKKAEKKEDNFKSETAKLKKKHHSGKIY